MCVSCSRGAVSSSSLTRRRCCPGCQSLEGSDHCPILPSTATTFWKPTHRLSLLVLPWKSLAGFSSRVPGAGRCTGDSVCTNILQKSFLLVVSVCDLMIDSAFSAFYESISVVHYRLQNNPEIYFKIIFF